MPHETYLTGISSRTSIPPSKLASDGRNGIQRTEQGQGKAKRPETSTATALREIWERDPELSIGDNADIALAPVLRVWCKTNGAHIVRSCTGETRVKDLKQPLLSGRGSLQGQA